MSKILKSSKVKFGIPVEIENNKNIILNNTALAEKLSQQPEPDNIIDIKLVEKQCGKMINHAKEEADGIIHNARIEAEKLKKEIFETAREEGYNKGFYEISEKAESHLKEAEKIKKKAQEEFNQLMMSSESEIVKLVISIFKKVYGSLSDDGNDLIISITKNMLSKYKSSNWAKVRVSSKDYDLVIANSDMIIQNSGYSGDIEFKKDLSLEKGSCIVETDSGIVDASINQQIEKIEKLLQELCNK